MELEAIIENVKIYPQNRISSSQAIPLICSQFCGMSATPDNQRDYSDKVGPLHLNPLVDGILMYTLLSRENTTKFYILEGSASITDLLKQSTQNLLIAVLDLGALFKDKSNAENAQEYLKFAWKYDKHFVVFFHRFEESTDNHLAVGMMQNDQFIIQRLVGSRSEDFQKAGIMPTKCVFYYDQPHTFGTDLPIPANATAVVTADAHSDWTQLSQALKRMRQFETSQSIHFAYSKACQKHCCGDTRSMSVTTLLHQAISNQVYCSR